MQLLVVYLQFINFVGLENLAMIGGMSAVENDVIPYGLAIGNRAKINRYKY